MIKNKCFAKKRRKGYCLLVALLRIEQSNESGYSLRELCYNPEKVPYFRNFLNNFS